MSPEALGPEVRDLEFDTSAETVRDDVAQPLYVERIPEWRSCNVLRVPAREGVPLRWAAPMSTNSIRIYIRSCRSALTCVSPLTTLDMRSIHRCARAPRPESETREAQGGIDFML